MKKIKFITEIASTHNGNTKVIEYLTNKHLNSQSDFIKYQIFKSSNLIEKKDKDFKKFKKIEIDFSNWEKIIKKYYNKTKLILEPFDEESYFFCKKFKKYVDIKISTTETDNINLIQDSLKNFKRVFINISGFEEKYIKFILKKFLNKKNRKKLIFLYGFQAFPSKPEDLRFNLFELFKKNRVNFGYSDHSVKGLSSDLITTLPAVLNKGISFYEKHVCKNLSKKPPDFISSLEFEDFRKLITAVKTYEKLDKNQNKLSESEKKYSKVMHKFAFAKKDIQKGEKILIKDLLFLRTKKKYAISRDKFLNKKVYSKRKIKKNSLLIKKYLIYK